MEFYRHLNRLAEPLERSLDGRFRSKRQCCDDREKAKGTLVFLRDDVALATYMLRRDLVEAPTAFERAWLSGIGRVWVGLMMQSIGCAIRSLVF